MKQALVRFWDRIRRENLLFNFHGRATRREFLLFTTLALATIGLAAAVGTDIFSIVVALLGLFIFLAASARRLHDTGFSAWSLLLLAIPYIGIGMYLFFVFTAGEKGPNRYGPNPRFKPDTY
ncbi:DUF805 domain-containing protein [Qipengyuania xiapuensis]|uniref:DUF805 domain-containing protein n=1 Tax=Qipengyuania xiapuensis TaxID=2867236 RepID=A0ABX8ZUH9_9SPHN|nr:DUF805 domain-containing protein [Qipengyuania xiapuensis]QZD92532.1 DUF805 domain-containing protein [Qipengyuania xiapuensis]